MSGNNKEIGERIFNVIKLLEMTVDKFAEAVNTTKFRLYSYKAGKAEAPQDLLEEMESRLEINSKYIRKGEEPIFLRSDKTKDYSQTQLRLLKMETRNERKIPIYLMGVSAGKPSPVDDYIDRYMNVDKIFTENHFIIQVIGDSMINAKIENGDKLLVDANRHFKEGDIVIAAVDGDLTLKRIKKVNGYVLLYPENPDYKPVPVTENTEILGVVVWIIKETDFL
jgi:DNA polymerase V